mmetsp:Transcript_36292/g.113062  ORF Transcript_36292/g.113062 Transcript_36292/m.113062 type:complete len:284 (+) Transcript_36292:369-1220(+)
MQRHGLLLRLLARGGHGDHRDHGLVERLVRVQEAAAKPRSDDGGRGGRLRARPGVRRPAAPGGRQVQVHLPDLLLRLVRAAAQRVGARVVAAGALRGLRTARRRRVEAADPFAPPPRLLGGMDPLAPCVHHRPLQEHHARAHDDRRRRPGARPGPGQPDPLRPGLGLDLPGGPEGGGPGQGREGGDPVTGPDSRGLPVQTLPRGVRAWLRACVRGCLPAWLPVCLRAGCLPACVRARLRACVRGCAPILVPFFSGAAVLAGPLPRAAMCACGGSARLPARARA